MAAEPREFGGLLAHCTRVSRLDWPVVWARCAELEGARLWMVANGAGSEQAGRAVETAWRPVDPHAIVSMGFCGALDHSLAIGEIFVATAIAGRGGRFDVGRPQAEKTHACGLLATIDHVAQDAEEKEALRASGAVAVDMETAGVAARARQFTRPHYCIRAVTDLARESFANDFNAALRPDGRFDTMHLLRAAARKPGARIPELFRLRRRCQTAAQNLGDFLAHCRF